MREILFRGKRDKRFGDGWSYGLLRKGGNYRYISNCGSCICVIPETVGQYTGLTDKNGNRIFEGDIVEFYFYDKTRRNGKLVKVKNARTMLIEWCEGSFYMRELFRNYRLDKEMDVITETVYDYRGDRRQGVYKSNSSYFVEVVGNIHDNPELLETD